MRDSTIFYRSFFEAIKELPTDKQGEIYNAIFEYSMNFNEVELSGISKTIFTLIKPQIDANIKRYRNGKEPKTKQPESKTQAKQKQETSKTEANKNDNVNVNDNDNDNVKENDIESRKLKFASSLKPFIDKFGKTMLNDFYRYWTEPNKSNTKFRYELEKAWDLERRLDTWAKKDSTFTKGANFQQKPDTLKNINIDDIKY